MRGLRVKIGSLLCVLMGLAPVAAGAQGLGLPVASFAAGGTGLTAFYVLGFELGPWQEYLAQELTPDYMLPQGTAPVRVSWLSYGDVAILPDFAAFLDAKPDTYFYMNVEWQSSGVSLAPRGDVDATFMGTRFERRYFSPGFEQKLSDDGVLGVAAVIAYQRFSSATMGMMATSRPDNPFFPMARHSPYDESGYGTGVRLDIRQDLAHRFAFETGFQSRINMAEFAAIRGVYANPADLDIPARARVGLDFHASERSWLNVAVERVMYSDITAFPSRYLPNRFLSLLGDSTSPSFEWQDLTVYTVGWRWSDGADQNWHVDFSTRPQPSPTSRMLRQALQSDVADNAMTLGYARRTGPTSHLNFNAAYAPSEYAFGGSVLGVTTDKLDRRFEVEALWTYAF
jgi:hypothetical protein